MDLLKDILFILFPVRCEVCGRILSETEKILCSGCFFHLPRTNFHNDIDNPVAALFWGRVNIKYASSYFHFYKGSPYQKLLHKLKYKGQKNIGVQMGMYFGGELKNSCFAEADLIIPVPLHPKKQKQRGYNQSESIACGISAILNIPMNINTLLRSEFTETQTKKSRFERYQNMEGKFEIRDNLTILKKSVILIDDVVTTGSTLEACANILLKHGCREVSILTLAVA